MERNNDGEDVVTEDSNEIKERMNDFKKYHTELVIIFLALSLILGSILSFVILIKVLIVCFVVYIIPYSLWLLLMHDYSFDKPVNKCGWLWFTFHMISINVCFLSAFIWVISIFFSGFMYHDDGFIFCSCAPLLIGVFVILSNVLSKINIFTFESINDLSDIVRIKAIIITITLHGSMLFCMAIAILIDVFIDSLDTILKFTHREAVSIAIYLGFISLCWIIFGIRGHHVVVSKISAYSAQHHEEYEGHGETELYRLLNNIKPETPPETDPDGSVKKD